MRVRRGIRDYLVRWRGYSKEFKSWVPESSVKNILHVVDTLLRDSFKQRFSRRLQQNTHAGVTVKLAQEVDRCSTAHWEVWISAFLCSTSPEVDIPSLIYCNTLSPQFVGESTVRCIRKYSL